MGGLSNLATLGINLALEQQAGRRASRELANEERVRRRQLAEQFAAQQRRTEENLRRQLAAARARAGAAGVATGGSFDAILRGLEAEAARMERLRRAELGADLDLLRERLGARRRRNLLESGSRLLQLGRRGLGGLASRRPSLLD